MNDMDFTVAGSVKREKLLALGRKHGVELNLPLMNELLDQLDLAYVEGKKMAQKLIRIQLGLAVPSDLEP